MKNVYIRTCWLKAETHVGNQESLREPTHPSTAVTVRVLLGDIHHRGWSHGGEQDALSLVLFLSLRETKDDPRHLIPVPPLKEYPPNNLYN